MAARKNPRLPANNEAFHAAVRRLRTTLYIAESTLAGPAGLTLRVYIAMELGEVQVSRAFYDAAVTRFPQLKTYPRPAADPERITPVHHPAVIREYERTQGIREITRQLNVGTTNKELIRRLLLLAYNGDMTPDDIDRL